MFQKVFRLTGDQPVEDIAALLSRLRASERDHEIGFGSPPFERNGHAMITGVRLRFVPRVPLPVEGPAGMPQT